MRDFTGEIRELDETELQEIRQRMIGSLPASFEKACATGLLSEKEDVSFSRYKDVALQQIAVFLEFYQRLWAFPDERIQSELVKTKLMKIKKNVPSPQGGRTYEVWYKGIGSLIELLVVNGEKRCFPQPVLRLHGDGVYDLIVTELIWHWGTVRGGDWNALETIPEKKYRSIFKEK